MGTVVWSYLQNKHIKLSFVVFQHHSSECALRLHGNTLSE